MSNYKHGKAGTPLYKIYYGVRGRCHNPKDHGYYKYGAKGIKMCQIWRNSFEAFYVWAIKNGYKNGLSLDRKDVFGDYTPENCRWETRSVQAQNIRPRSKTPYVHFNKSKNRYIVRFQINKKRTTIGRFKTKLEAINAIVDYVVKHDLKEQRKVLRNAGFAC